jgi:hypothetical protein
MFYYSLPVSNFDLLMFSNIPILTSFKNFRIVILLCSLFTGRECVPSSLNNHLRPVKTPY